MPVLLNVILAHSVKFPSNICWTWKNVKFTWGHKDPKSQRNWVKRAVQRLCNTWLWCMESQCCSRRTSGSLACKQTLRWLASIEELCQLGWPVPVPVRNHHGWLPWEGPPWAAPSLTDKPRPYKKSSWAGQRVKWWRAFLCGFCLSSCLLSSLTSLSGRLLPGNVS